MFYVNPDYLNHMHWLITIPSLVCGLAISVTDLRRRIVPRPWVMAGVAVQCAVFLAAGIRSHDLWPFVCACFGLLGAAGVQLSLAMAIPSHALGLGDVTASGMAGFATGYFGLECFLWFWLCMGVLGVGWVAAYVVYSRVLSRGRTGDGVGRLRVPFVPVIATAAALAVMCCA